MKPSAPIPHYLRFARALALVTGALTTSCGSTVGPAPFPAQDAASTYDGLATGTTDGPSYDGVAVGIAPYDGATPGADVGVADAPAWDGVVVGVSPWIDAAMPPGDSGIAADDSIPYDGVAVGVSPWIDAAVGHDGFCCGVIINPDAAVPHGILPYDAGPADAAPDVRHPIGGPLSPPELAAGAGEWEAEA